MPNLLELLTFRRDLQIVGALWSKVFVCSRGCPSSHNMEEVHILGLRLGPLTQGILGHKEGRLEMFAQNVGPKLL